MMSLEELKARLESELENLHLEIIPNAAPGGEASLLVPSTCIYRVGRYLHDAEDLQFDYLSNVSGVDWLDREVTEKVKVTRTVTKEVEGVSTQVEETVEEVQKQLVPGYLEVVYHLYSVPFKQGPLVLRARTANRSDQVDIPSVVAIWRSAEYQEREVFDLYGVNFTRHPDLRRLLMWPEFKDFPMRRDYVEPDDFDYEPTATGELLKKAEAHRAAAEAAAEGKEESR